MKTLKISIHLLYFLSCASQTDRRDCMNCGNGLLDAAALKAARLYRFLPAKNVAGQGVSTKTAIPFIFRLK